MKRFGKVLIGLAMLLTCSAAFADPISVVVGIMTIVEATAATEAVIAGILYVGGALSIVGGLTQNKSLERIGGLVSLGGSVGNLAVNLAKEAGTTVATEAGKEVVADAGKSATTDALSDINAATNPGQAVANSTSITENLAGKTTTFGGADAALPGASTVDAAPTTIGQAGTTGDIVQAPSTGGGVMPEGATSPSPGTVTMPEASAPLPGSTAGGIQAPSSGGFWKNFTDDPSKWLRQNKDMVSVGGGLIKSGMEALVPTGKDKAALQEAQLARDKFNADQKRLANYNQSVIGASGSHIGYDPNSNPFNPAVFDPTRFIPNTTQVTNNQWQPNQPAGLINGARG